jgi:hypothetical protein
MTSPRKLPAKPVRTRGVLRFLVGASFFVPILMVLVLLSEDANALAVPIALLLPGAYAFAGLAEFITGVPFVELSKRWNHLKGWQRGLLGTLIVLGGLIVLITIFALIAVHFA